MACQVRGRAEMESHAKTGMAYIVGHYFMTSVGYFGLLSTLVVILSASSFDAAQIALLIATFSIANRAAKIPLAPWLDKIPTTYSVLAGCWLAALGFACLGLAANTALMAVALMVAGTGVAINSLAIKQLAAAASDLAGNRAKVFGIINVAVNVSSAIAAPLALMLVEHGMRQYVAPIIALIYFSAGTITFLNFSKIQTAPGTVAKPSLRSYLEMLKVPGLPGFMLINAMGWFLYGQLFNTVALHVSKTLGSPVKLGWLYSLNAVLVVCFQLAVTSFSERACRGNPMLTILLSYAVYMMAFVSAYLVPGYPGMVVLVTLFTFAEMMFIPSVDVLLLGLIGKHNRAVAYSILAVSIAIGESLGGGAGVAAYRWLSLKGATDGLWLAIGALALAFIAIAKIIERSSSGLRSLAMPAAIQGGGTTAV